MTPTEHEGTVAVDAAARALYAVHVKMAAEHGGAPQPTFDELDPNTARVIRESVLPQVWAALEALPDRAAWPGAADALDAIDGDDGEGAHSEADKLLLAQAPADVRAAYDRLVERAAFWACA